VSWKCLVGPANPTSWTVESRKSKPTDSAVVAACLISDQSGPNVGEVFEMTQPLLMVGSASPSFIS
jgi:hypothetical protein